MKKRYRKATKFLPWNMLMMLFNNGIRPVWIKNSNNFWYLEINKKGNEYKLVDLSKKRQYPMFDHERVAQFVSEKTGESISPTNLPIKKLDLDSNPGYIRAYSPQISFEFNVQEYIFKEIPPVQIKANGKLKSPDEKKSVFIENNNLILSHNQPNEQQPITFDGKEHFDYGSSPEWNCHTITDKRYNITPLPVALWSPDSTKIIFQRLNQQKIEDLVYIQSVPENGSTRPLVHKIKYPFPGDKYVGEVELFIYNLSDLKLISVNMSPLACHLLTPLEQNRLWWDDESEFIYCIQKSRDNKTLTLVSIDAKTGSHEVIYSETGKTFVQSSIFWKPNVKILPKQDKFIWFSQKDGWGHLYLHQLSTGKLINQITQGSWVVHNIIAVDEMDQIIYFTAGGRENGRDPYYSTLYSINFDGSNIHIKTPEEANHEIFISPQGNFTVDTISRVNLPSRSVVRNMSGDIIIELQNANLSAIKPLGWQFPEPFNETSKDGTNTLYGVMFKPSDFNPQQKYPLIVCSYGAPQIFSTPKSFPNLFNIDSMRDFWEPQALAELGFIVIRLDGRGSPGRSKEFHDYCYNNLGYAGDLENHVHVIKELSNKHSFIDIERVGIYGHSGGGYAAARAMFLYPKFFKVAFASSGNHENDSYLASWGEKYHDMSNHNLLQQSNVSIAHQLKGKILFVCGDMDDNVHYSHTMKVIDALIKSNKDFDLLVIPNQNHNIVVDGYYTRKKWDYFVRHLLGETPPKNFKVRGLDPKFLRDMMAS